MNKVDCLFYLIDKVTDNVSLFITHVAVIYILQTPNMFEKHCLIFLLISKCQSQQLVTVSGGEVRGTVLISHNDQPFWAFQGYLSL